MQVWPGDNCLYLIQRGTVFPDRYHERVLGSPRQCRNAIAYVLNNFRRHGEDRGRTWLVDPLSSAVNFGGWRELAGTNQLFGTPAWYERLPTSTPRTWLLSVGWTKHPLIAAQISLQAIMPQMIVRYARGGESMDKVFAWAENELEGFKRT